MALHNHINQHFQISLHLQPLGIFVDFEIALFKEAQLAFHCSEVLGCLFHFSKNIKKKTNSLSTASALYQSNPEFALSCRMVMAIALVPLQYLEEAVGALKSMIPADALGLLEWLEDNYMGTCIMLNRFRTLCVCVIGTKLRN